MEAALRTRFGSAYPASTETGTRHGTLLRTCWPRGIDRRPKTAWRFDGAKRQPSAAARGDGLREALNPSALRHTRTLTRSLSL